MEEAMNEAGREAMLALGLEVLGQLPATALKARLGACCGARRWVTEMTAKMASQSPIEAVCDFYRMAEEAADILGREDWLEAFSHHPRIGDIESLKARFGGQSGSWSEGEQAGVDGAAAEILERLATGNRLYEERFGFLFLVCATGKTAAEMLGLLEERLGNGPGEEISIAAGEQTKITRLRLEKLLLELGRERMAT